MYVFQLILIDMVLDTIYVCAQPMKDGVTL